MRRVVPSSRRLVSTTALYRTFMTSHVEAGRLRALKKDIDNRKEPAEEDLDQLEGEATKQIGGPGAVHRTMQNTGPSGMQTVDPAGAAKLYEEEIPVHYELLQCHPKMPLSEIKIKYLMRCRENHPEIGGNPDHYIKIAEAYQTVMKEHGVEIVDNEGFNFGPKVSIPSFLEKLQLEDDKERQLLVNHANRLRLTDGEEKEEIKKPFREKFHIYNLFFRKKRDKPTLPVRGDDKANEMTKTEYEDALKRADAAERRKDVVGAATSTATEVMWNVKEAKQNAVEGFVLYCTAMGVIFIIGFTFHIYRGMRQKFEERPDLNNELAEGTMLPWWGNDYEYEKQVKRIFIEEWKNARKAARRVQTFTEGTAREDYSDEERLELDTKIFEVSDERAQALHDNIARLDKIQSDKKPLTHDKLMAPLGQLPRGTGLHPEKLKVPGY